MPDFYQHNQVATLHHFGGVDLDVQEAALETYAGRRPVSLILPALFSELEGEALPAMLGELAQAAYVDEVVVSMNRMNAEQFAEAKDFFSVLPQKVWILWNDGPRLQELYHELERAGLASYTQGKGCNVWMAIGFILARGKASVIATHDSDILTYSREMLMRLCLPTMHPEMGYEFSKSYYGRVTDRMYGRVTRLFVSPFLRSLLRIFGSHPLVEFLDSFRYPLSGEFAMRAELAGLLRASGDWGLEIGMLCEVYRNTRDRRMCQVDLGSNYEHKHQRLGYDPDNPDPEFSGGLVKMVKDIARTLFVYLSSDGMVLSTEFFDSLQKTYVQVAAEYVRRYQDDAEINGLVYDRVAETAMVEAFSQALAAAVREYKGEPGKVRSAASWNRVNAMVPHFSRRLEEAVYQDGNVSAQV